MQLAQLIHHATEHLNSRQVTRHCCSAFRLCTLDKRHQVRKTLRHKTSLATTAPNPRQTHPIEESLRGDYFRAEARESRTPQRFGAEQAGEPGRSRSV
jgi:hypothetical protein